MSSNNKNNRNHNNGRTVFQVDVNAVDAACSSDCDSWRAVGGVRLTGWAVASQVSSSVMGILASKHAIISPANPRVATAYRRQLQPQPSSPSTAECFQAREECVGIAEGAELLGE
jgi:hypothetical protein